ncbi:MAG: carboxypeptidase-like regulatory domain-containing protein [Draconibacterium sp.]|nr:carboxypeptidase-like regulatory domain-containing protein [Draconibacterium sp.]
MLCAGNSKGATSDAKGFYKLQLPVGNQTINSSCIGRVSTTRNLNLYSDGKLDVDMEIMVNILEGAEVVAHGKEILDR